MKLVSACCKSLCLASLWFSTPLASLDVLAEDKQPQTAIGDSKSLYLSAFDSQNPKPKFANSTSNTCKQDLAAAIEEIISRPDLKRSRWGIEVQTLDREVLYSLDGDKFFTPASSAKLLTTAAVLSQMDADYQIATPLYGIGSPPNLTSLRLKGQGDPSISTKSLKTIVHQLQALGVKKIEKLIIDDSYFEPPAINPTWEWLDVHSYFATAVNSTILNQNAVTLTLLPQQLGQPVKFYWNDSIAARQWQVINHGVTGKKDLSYNIEIDGDMGKPALTIRGELAINESPDVWDMAVVDPADYFLESLRLQLIKGGIEVTRGIVVKESQKDRRERLLLEIVAPSIQQIVNKINQDSNNLYAEAIAKVLAQKFETKTNIEAIERGLTKLGISNDEYVLVDASGLSRQNLVAPKTLVKTLSLMSRSPYALSYRQSLAVAGISGTLKNRFINTAVEGNLWGKTGTLTRVSSLSGYLTMPDSSTIVFSIVVNNSELKSTKIRQAIDYVVRILNHKGMCSRSLTIL